MKIKRTLPSCLILTLFVFLIATTNTQTVNCNATDLSPLKGCLQCPSGSVPALNNSNNKMICSTDLNCVAVNSTGQCVSCKFPNILNISSGSCEISDPGCLLLQAGGCSQCLGLYRLNATSRKCELKTIDYCWTVDVSGCLECAVQQLAGISDCAVPASNCSSFDYKRWTCLQCPDGTRLDQSGVYCVRDVLNNCIIFGLGGCLQCSDRYLLNGSECISGVNINLLYQLLPSNYSLNKIAYTTLNMCLNLKNQFNLNNSQCQIVASALPATDYCLQANSSICISCFVGFYLDSSSKCKLCRDKYTNCLSCDQFNCLQCQPRFYLGLELGSAFIYSFFGGMIAQSVSSCLPCSIYSCELCRNQMTQTGTSRVLCDKCLFGYKLFNYTCYMCPSGRHFSLLTKICQPCIVSNCMYCNTNPNTCDQCIAGYYFSDSQCRIPTQLNVVTAENITQVLNKSLPFSIASLYNDQQLLITSCKESSNGYACLCSGQSVNFTSFCYQIPAWLSTISITPSLLAGSPTPVTNTITRDIFVTNRVLLQMLSQLPQYPFQFTPTTSDLLSPVEIASYFQITVNRIRNQNTITNSLVLEIAQAIFNTFAVSFSPHVSTVMIGPGYYVKYNPPALISDDSSFLSLSGVPTNTASAVIVLFNSTPDSNRTTGTFFVFLQNFINANIGVKIKKTGFLGSDQIYGLIQGNNQTQADISSDSQGYLNIPAINSSQSLSSLVRGYYVSAVVTSAISQAYQSQRIENIIYQQAFIYILVFLCLYLIFVPLCALTDCVDNKSTKRVVQKQSEDSTYQGIQHRTQSDVQDVILRINYKDFFPIYNIANTSRPKRLVKLCLFIVNMQHGLTFLVLIYFHLTGGQPLAAVLLAIPAYICTLIAGYICGFIVRCLSGHWKYLINILTIGYWALWIALFPLFYSEDYKPFVIAFVVIFLAIDLLIDCLETLLMYFTIKQEEKQLKLFKYLSKWLSYRGYYQFDEMAKDINELREKS